MTALWDDPAVTWDDPAVTWDGAVYVPPPPPPPPPPPVPTPPRPAPTRARWVWAAGAAGELDFALTKIRGRRITWRLGAGHDCSFQVDGRSEQADAIEELVTDVHVIRDGVRVYRGRVVPTSDSFDADRHDVTVTASSYRALLARRLLQGAGVVLASDDQSDQAWAVVQHVQAQTGGDLGIVRGVGAVTGVNRAVDFAAGILAGQALGQLELADDGFDWDVGWAEDPTDDALTFDVYYPRRGDVRDEPLDYVEGGENIEGGGRIQTGTRIVNPAGYGNAVRVTGATGLTPEVRLAAGLAAAPEGRWDLGLGLIDVATQPALAAIADRQLEVSSLLVPSYSLTLKKGEWGGPDALWLGDEVPLLIRSGRLDVATVGRVSQIDVALDEEDEETVTVSLGPPPLSAVVALQDQTRRLATLERR